MSGPGGRSIRGMDPAAENALDRFDVPPPSDDFVARMIAIADVSPPAEQVVTAAPRWKARLQRSRRGPWMRRTAIGLIAVGLASATAAAAGIFDTMRFDMPVIARLLVPAKPEPVIVKAVRTKPEAQSRMAAAADPAPPGNDQLATAPRLLTPAERAERFRALPLPVRAVVTERMVTRTQRRLAARGIFVPRDMVRERVAARTGQNDLPQGSAFERRAQMRAALIAASPESLPPRLERLRARLLLQEAALPDQSGLAAGADIDPAEDIRTQQARQAWRDLRRDQMLRRRARRADMATPGQSTDAPLLPSQADAAPAAEPSPSASNAPDNPATQAPE